MSYFSLFRNRSLHPEYINKYLSQDFKVTNDTSIADIPFIVIDAETTGFGKSDRIVTLGGVYVQNATIDLSTILDQKYILHQNSEAAEIHGELLDEGGSDVDDNFKTLLNFLSSRVIVGHSVGFDIAKINKAIGDKYPGFRIKNKVIDTFDLLLRLDRVKYERLVGGKHKLQLDEVCQQLGIPVENRHTALGDAFMTAQLLLFLLDRLDQRGVQSAGALLR